MENARSQNPREGPETQGISPKFPAFGILLVSAAPALISVGLQSLPSGASTAALLVAAAFMWASGLVLTLRAFRRASEAVTEACGPTSAELAQLLQIWDRPPLGCFVTDSDGVIRRANAPLHELLGKAPGTLIGYAVNELDICHEQAVAGSESPATYEHPDGERRELNLWHMPLRDGHGTIINQATWVADVTSRNRLARELDEARARLRQNERLETLGTLAGGLAHDLNNLLAPIVGYVDLAQLELPDDAPVQKDLGLVRTAAGRAADLATRLLRLARAERDQVEPVHVEEIVHEVLTLLAPRQGVSIEILERVDAGCPPVLAATTQLHQVILNLCKNALHAMPTGGALTVAVDHVDALATWETRPKGDGPFVRVRVTDTGTGMDAETLDRIYDPLFTTKGRGQGSGLGLAMVQGIVRGFEGTISVASKPGVGTTFTLLFPPVRERKTTPSPQAGERQPTSGHILLVDDDEAVLSVMSRSLSRLGYEVTAFLSSEDALKSFLERPDAFDLVLTDQMMPALTGMELLAKVRDARPDLPAVLTTGRADTIPQEEMERLRCALLPKPSSTDQLNELVSRELKRASAVLTQTGVS